MDVIETLMSDNQLWFQEKINQLVHEGYSVLSTSTNCDSCDRIIWTAVLKNSKKGW